MNKIIPLMKRKYLSENGIQEIMTMETSSSICFSDHGTVVASCPNGSSKRKTMNSVSKIYTYAPHADGHQWRKYGEKKIGNTKLSRGYYRCTYSKDQGCQARKHVEEQNCNDLPFFLVTYYEYHSCKNTNPMINTQVNLLNPLTPMVPKLVSFESNAKSKQEWSILLSPLNLQHVSQHERVNNQQTSTSSSSVLNCQPVSLDQAGSVSAATHDQYDGGNLQTKGNTSIISNLVPPSINQITVKSVAKCEYFLGAMPGSHDNEDLSSILDQITPASPAISMDFFMMDYSTSDEGFAFHSF